MDVRRDLNVPTLLHADTDLNSTGNPRGGRLSTRRLVRRGWVISRKDSGG